MSSERLTRSFELALGFGGAGAPRPGGVGGLEGGDGQLGDEARLALGEEHGEDVVEELRRRRSDGELVEPARELFVACSCGAMRHVIPRCLAAASRIPNDSEGDRWLRCCAGVGGASRRRILARMSAGRPFLIVNPSSGKMGGSRSLARFTAAVERALGDVDFAATERRGHAVDLARRAAGEGRETIVAVGGDGTLNEVVNGVMQAGAAAAARAPPVGLIGLGTGGDFGHSLGIGRGLNDYLDAIAGGHTRRVDLLRVAFRDHDGRPLERYVVNVLSVGPGGLVDRYVEKIPSLLGGRVVVRPGVGLGAGRPARALACACACRDVTGRRRARGLDLPAGAVQRRRLWRRHAPGARRRARRRPARRRVGGLRLEVDGGPSPAQGLRRPPPGRARGRGCCAAAPSKSSCSTRRRPRAFRPRRRRRAARQVCR